MRSPHQPTSMSEAQPPNSPTKQDLRVPLTDVVRFVRQLSHDLRNHLNAAELQSAYINEIAEDAETKGEVQRLRGMLSEMGGSLQRLTTSLSETKLTTMEYEAAAFLEDLQGKIAMQFAEEKESVDWDVNVGTAALEIDPQLLQQAMLELFANALRHERGAGRIILAAAIEGNECRITLHEPKLTSAPATENWGREPFKKVRHGHYGLGLHRARSIIEAHHGRLKAGYDAASSSLITSVTLPISGQP